MEVHRRRLIVEDSQDDFEPPVLIKKEPGMMADREGKKKGRKLVKMGEVTQPAGTSQERLTPRQVRKKKGSLLHLPDDAPVGGKPSILTRSVKKKGSWKAKGDPPAPLIENHEAVCLLMEKGKSIVEDHQGDERIISDESLSAEDELRFVIKSRRMPADQEQLVQPGQVKKVVAAFEEGLVLNEANGSLDAAKEEVVLKLNEYGSNLEGGNRKWSIQ
ncbi:unnamed protein product [Linum trigynum]